MKSIKFLVIVYGMLAMATCHKSHSRHQGKEKASVFSALRKENSPKSIVYSLESQAEQMIRNRRKAIRFAERGSTFYKGKGKKINSTTTEKADKAKENPKFSFKNGNELILKEDLNITLPGTNATLTANQLKEAFSLLSSLKGVCGDKFEKCNFQEMAKLRFARVVPSANYTSESKDSLNSTNSTRHSNLNKTISPRDHLQRLSKKLVTARKNKREVKWEKPIILHRFLQKQDTDPYASDRSELEHYGHIVGNEDSIGYGEMVEPDSADEDDKSGLKATIAAVEKDENDLFNEGDSSTESLPDSGTAAATNMGDMEGAAGGASITEDHNVNGPSGDMPQGFGDGPAAF